jgi:molybdopterin/thiamine biosynthesis adenylyltransferase
MPPDRFDRNIRFFGKEGQARLHATRVVVVGVGGLGTHVVQQLALLGVGSLGLIDGQVIDESNLNRYVGARHDDAALQTLKVDAGERLVASIDPTITVTKVAKSFITEEGFAAIEAATHVFGCLDREGARLVLMELCAASALPYIDLASGIDPDPPMSYGGHVCVAWDGNGCLSCLGLLDTKEAQQDLAGPEGEREHEALYGVRPDMLSAAGPSVVSLNGIIASLGATEFMLAVTGIRAPKSALTYRASFAKLSMGNRLAEDCYYCKGIWGTRARADAHRYVRSGIGQWLA